MCKTLDIKPSSYYDWTKRDISAQQIHRNRCELLIKAAHSETKERYGYERLHAHLSEQGHDVSKYMVRSIKEEHEIKCRRHKRFKVTTDSEHNKRVYPNLLKQQFGVKRPNCAWVSRCCGLFRSSRKAHTLIFFYINSILQFNASFS